MPRRFIFSHNDLRDTPSNPEQQKTRHFQQSGGFFIPLIKPSTLRTQN
jgi:hypothetical protein